MPGAAGSGLGEQSLDDHLRLLVFAFAEVVMPDASLGVGEVESGPVVVGERDPDRVFVIERDRVVDRHVRHGPAENPASCSKENSGVCTPMTASPCRGTGRPRRAGREAGGAS